MASFSKNKLSLQQQLYDTSLMINERTIPVQYYSEYLQRTRALIKEVGALIDGVALLNKKASGVCFGLVYIFLVFLPKSNNIDVN